MLALCGLVVRERVNDPLLSRWSSSSSEFHHPKNASGKNKDGSSKKQMWTTESWKGLEAEGRTDTAAAALAAVGKSGKGKRTAAACCVS